MTFFLALLCVCVFSTADEGKAGSDRVSRNFFGQAVETIFLGRQLRFDDVFGQAQKQNQ